MSEYEYRVTFEKRDSDGEWKRFVGMSGPDESEALARYLELLDGSVGLDGTARNVRIHERSLTWQPAFPGDLVSRLHE